MSSMIGIRAEAIHYTRAPDLDCCATNATRSSLLRAIYRFKKQPCTFLTGRSLCDNFCKTRAASVIFEESQLKTVVCLRMAGYSEKDVDTENDWEWQPPSEAEMKIIQARRERSDRISKIMGSYLLKGYKMLASECKKCGTIELEDKKKKIYCVGCEEVDPEIQKDSPALNEKAASSQRAEQNFLNEKPGLEEKPEQAATSSESRVTPSFDQPASPLQDPSRSHKCLNDIHTSPSTDVEEEGVKCIQSIQKKMVWARLSLERETDPNAVAAYLKVITGCVETINTLRKYSC